MALNRKPGCCCGGGGGDMTNCVSCDVPLTLTLTDGDGSLTFTSPGPPDPPLWYAQKTVAASCRSWLGPTGDCNLSSATSGDVLVCYQMGCNDDGSFTLGRTWGGVSDDFTTWTDWCWDPDAGANCDASGLPCATTPGRANDTEFASACGPSFSISFSLAVVPGTLIPDPVGSGSVTVVA